MKNFIFIILLLFSKSDIYLNDNNKNINIAVASNFTTTLNIIINEFKKINNCNFYINSDSTSNLFFKINNGAKFDIFLSADSKHVNLIKNNNKKKSYIYAYGKIVIFSKKKYIKKNTLKYIFDENKIFISNYKLSPYGMASFYFIKNLNIKINHIQYGLNINQTYNYIKILNNGIGIIAFSHVKQDKIENTQFKIIPKYCYNSIKQKIILLNENNKCAYIFFKYIKNTDIKFLIKENGYKINKND